MQIGEKFYCTQKMLPFVKEANIKSGVKTLSITGGFEESFESMIFLHKMEQDSDKEQDFRYELMIYKKNPKNNTYKENKKDPPILNYKDEGEYDEFQFEDFKSAHEFIISLSDNHPEYKMRPWKKFKR